MYNFKPGGIRHRKEFLGGRPKSDADYGTKKRFDNNKSRHDRSDSREMKLFPAICTTCGKSCEVPFRPDGTKPVLCRDCFADKNSSPAKSSPRDRFSADSRQERRPERQFETNRAPVMNVENKHTHDRLVQQISALDTKLSELFDYVKLIETKVSSLLVPVSVPEIAPKSVKSTKVAAVKSVEKKQVKTKTEKKIATKKEVKKEPKMEVKKVVKKAVKTVKKAKK